MDQYPQMPHSLPVKEPCIDRDEGKGEELFNQIQEWRVRWEVVYSIIRFSLICDNQINYLGLFFFSKHSSHALRFRMSTVAILKSNHFNFYMYSIVVFLFSVWYYYKM